MNPQPMTDYQPTVETPTPQPVTPTITLPAPKVKKSLLLPILLITIVLLVGGGYFAVTTAKNQARNKAYEAVDNNSTPITQATPSPTTTPNTILDQANWKTFTSTYGYAVKYPNGWTIRAPGGADPAKFYDPIFESPCSYDSGDLCMQIYISSIPYGTRADPTDGTPLINEDDKFSPYFLIDPNDKTMNKTNIKIGSADAIGFEYFQSTYYRTRWQYVVVADHNEIRYTITYEESQKNHVPITPEQWKNKSIFDAIINSFTFNKLNNE